MWIASWKLSPKTVFKGNCIIYKEKTINHLLNLVVFFLLSQEIIWRFSLQQSYCMIFDVSIVFVDFSAYLSYLPDLVDFIVNKYSQLWWVSELYHFH